MPRGRPKKKVKVYSEDEYCPQENLVQSSKSDHEQQMSYQQKSKENYSQLKKSMANVKLEKSERNLPQPSQQYQVRPSIPPGKRQISIEQIKAQILIHAPDMEGQIGILDDETLRQIYQTVVQPHVKPPQEDNKMQQETYEEPKPRQRSTHVQKMLDQILKSVPHMQEQVEVFDDTEIRELYEEVFPSSSNKEQPGKTVTNGNQPMTMNEVRQFLVDKIPQMVNDIKHLSDQDVLDVYEKYEAKDKSTEFMPDAIQYGRNYSQSQPKSLPGKQYSSQRPMPQQESFEQFDPMKKYSTKNDGNIKLESAAYNSDQQSSYGQFNNYKYGSNNRRNEPMEPMIPYNKSYKNMPPQHNPYSQISSYPTQVYNFHNNKRVSAAPPNPERYARTVIIVHTMQPGYVPPVPKSKCRCQCCIRKQCEMNDPNTLNEFIQSIIPKYSSRK